MFRGSFRATAYRSNSPRFAFGNCLFQVLALLCPTLLSISSSFFSPFIQNTCLSHLFSSLLLSTEGVIVLWMRQGLCGFCPAVWDAVERTWQHSPLSVSYMLTNVLWLDGVETPASSPQNHSTTVSSDVLGTLGQGTEQCWIPSPPKEYSSQTVNYTTRALCHRKQ